MKNAITPTRSENFPEWYQQVITHAELAENSPVRGCLIPLSFLQKEAEHVDGFAKGEKLNLFVLAPFVETDKVEKEISELGVTVRCIPLVQPKGSATCLFIGKPISTWVLYAKSY